LLINNFFDKGIWIYVVEMENGVKATAKSLQ